MLKRWALVGALLLAVPAQASDWYVVRDVSGNIIRLYANPQPGLTTEKLSDSDTAIRAFLAPPPILSATAFLDRLGQDGPALMSSPFAFALVRLAAAGSIRLDDPDVVAGMQAAVQAGAITSQRATELLAPP